MARYTNTFTADICLSGELPDEDIEKMTAETAQKIAKIITGADTVNIRNFKVFVHDDKGEDQGCTKENT